MITLDDIVFVFSGGSSNYDPFQSIGGDPSSVEISEISGNLFGSLVDPQLRLGIVDYRCFYVFNQNSTDTLYDFSVYVENTTTTSCLLGIKTQNEIQKITLSGSPVSGNLVLNYNGINMLVNFTTNMSQLATNFIQAFTTVGVLGVQVTAVANTGYYTVTINFDGDSGFKFHPLLINVSNNLSPTTEVFIEKIQQGSPINIISPQVANIRTKPENIEFVNYTPTNMLSLTSLRPLEGFPVWLQRIVQPGSDKATSQTFTFKVKGKVIS